MRTQPGWARRREHGMVLLLALVALLLILAVGAALVFMTAAESQLVGSQRASARSYEAALGGLEEGRGSLAKGDPTYIGPTPTYPSTNISSTIQFPIALNQVLYILNPSPAGEFTLADVTTNVSSRYYDWEYNSEWGAGKLATASKQSKTSDNVALAAAVTNFPPIPYKWVRLTVLTEQAALRDIDGSTGALNNTILVFWDPLTNRMNVSAAANRPGKMVYRITALALVPGTNATRLVQMDVGQPVPLTVDSALRTGGPGISYNGPTLNIKGDSDQVCNRPTSAPCQANIPCNYGVRSVGPYDITTGGGSTSNVTGRNQQPNSKFVPDTTPPNVPALINMFKAGAKQITDPATNVHLGPPPAAFAPCTATKYCSPNAVLGIAPTTPNPTGGDISTVTAPGTPETYYSPGDLVLGGPGASLIKGQGILLVDGDLTIDIRAGFRYYGLILVKGNIKFTKPAAGVNQPVVIHGAVIAGGTFDANFSNGAQVEIQMNPCLVESQFDNMPRPILAYREISR